MKKNSEYIIIAGCSRFGANIATVLSQSGKEVVIIDINENSFRKLSPNYSGFKIIGDATDIDVLVNADIKKATILVAATNDDDVNIMISQIGKKIFNVNKVVSRLYDDEKEFAYEGIDIDIIRPTTLTVNEFAKLLEINKRSKDTTIKDGIFKRSDEILKKRVGTY